MSVRRALPRLTAALVLTLLGLELGLRALVLGSSDLGADLRDPALFACQGRDDLYWRLLVRFDPGRMQRPAQTYDERVGWTTTKITPGTYEHADEETLGGRRPVLLFGDSYAMCTTPPEDCFQALLQRSELGTDLALLNYGVGGFGLDQTWLLAREVVERFRERDPIVIVSAFVGDDLNRCSLSFRQWPKPRFRAGGSGLELLGTGGLSSEDWLEVHPAAPTSYLWRWFVHGSHLPPWELRAKWGGYREPTSEHREVCVRLIDSITTELASLEVTAAFLIFPDADDLLRSEPYRWEELLLVERLEANEFPYVNARRELNRATSAKGLPHDAFFVNGHYDARGNEVVFGALLRALRGEFELRAD